MKIHLARNCEYVPDNIKALWRENFLEEVSESNIKSKSIKQPTITSHFNNTNSLSTSKTNEINQAILKAWVCCGFPFHTIENPFIIDLFRIAIPGYKLPSRDTLSGLDGWTSLRYDSIYNCIVTTSKRKEYLIKLKTYNKEKQTGIFMANEIQKIMQNVRIGKFKAVITDIHVPKIDFGFLSIVTDNGANLRVARRITHEKYPYILDLRCMAHAINLIASDFAEIDLIKNLIFNCGSIIGFFNNSHAAHGYYKEQLYVMKIKGGEIQSYCKTRWGTLYNTTDSLVRSKPVFYWILDNHSEVITNRNVLSLLQDEEFYSRYYQIASILKPVKELTNIFESRTANLADYFIGLIRLGAKINQIRSLGLKQAVLNKIYETASIMWHNLGHGETSCLNFLTEMRSWKQKSPPYNINYDHFKETPMKWWLSINVEDDETDQLQELALLLFSIVPSQAVCEWNFSTLKWFFGERRTKLNLLQIESMAKIRSYYISNSEKELKFYDKNISENELRKNIDESVITYNAFEDGILENENLEILEESENLEENGNLNENNELENNSYEENENDELVSSTNLDLKYDPIALAQKVLNEENGD
ncbi:hypothetical protein Glove_314g43 [Diversispora epigaea]|uniref:DUF659 domain-containing protein n=1 Tax=Diversispora epigaea TaxID=1348612 RepID=A0A397HYE4_9GLOM|nr:hypothetical protein Glove_314g43 [Diversispora epigaea]